jgi:hypothetical protein
MPVPGVSDPLDWDEASHAVADAYFAHELHPLTRSTAANVIVEGAEIGPVRIVHLGWGAPVTVDTAHPGGYAVNTPVSGRLESLIGHHELVATPDCAAIYPPTPSPAFGGGPRRSASSASASTATTYTGRCRGCSPNPHPGCPTAWT